jgi:hypothetical protein
MLIAYPARLTRNADYSSMQQQLCDSTPQCKEARAKLNAALSAYNWPFLRQLKTPALEGYVFDIDVETGSVVPVPPPAAAKKAKAEEKPTK